MNITVMMVVMTKQLHSKLHTTNASAMITAMLVMALTLVTQITAA